ncbi:MAG: benzoyl-CoA 2,3-dioxygenase component B [Acidimicrobiales bacterium]
MSTIDYSERIPNNVNLSDDRRLQRALESWQPRFADWWNDMGPVGFQGNPVYLRTAVDVGRDGWAHFDHVRMPDYRWGIFLSPQDTERTIGFGDLKGQPVWHEIPGEFRTDLRRLIVVQGDTEPASVEQQRFLGQTAPSLYDLRNLFQVNVEEGRHLWAMVYLLHRYFGRDGRDEADGMLERHSGDADQPRILGAFNEQTPDWLSFFMFTYFTDRDGKYQLGALRESAFDPLSRTCDFMLKEEAHHMFVGASGVGRVVQRTAELMNEHQTDDVTGHGGINLDTLQRYINFHFSVSLDLFGSERSTNAANYYAAGLKGRFGESDYEDDHVLDRHEDDYLTVVDGAVMSQTMTARALVNHELRSEYVEDCAKGLRRWNRTLTEHGIEAELTLPHVGFNRAVGVFRDHRLTPDGEVIDEPTWDAAVDNWLPTEAERSHVGSLMVAEYEPGKIAGWIAAPASGINANPVDYDYVRL